MKKFQRGLIKPTIANGIRKITQAAMAEMFRKARDSVRRKGTFELSVYQENLQIVKIKEGTELFIVEETLREAQLNKVELRVSGCSTVKGKILNTFLTVKKWGRSINKALSKMMSQ